MREELETKNEYEELLTKYTNELRERSDKSKIDLLCSLRGFDRETLDRQGVFYINEMTEMLIPEYFDKVSSLGVISETNKKPIFRNRWVFPIYTSDGKVQNMVGYSPYADERYIYGTSTYYRRRSTYYGLENLNLAYKLGYAIVTEGITDTIRLRDMGYLNSFAMCGTHISPFMISQLNRCKHGVIMFPDRDDAGLRAHKSWKFNRGVTIIVHNKYKDLDEMCYISNEDGTRSKNEENIAWVKEYIEMCTQWIKSDIHYGYKTAHESVAMI